MSDPSIFISAGEASGETYGALLLSELETRLKAQGRRVRFFGMGGERMAGAGLERIVRVEDVAVMGITEVVRHLPGIYREFRRLKGSIRDRRPDLAILIDFPDIHLKLAAEFSRLGVPVLYFVSPQLWAWKKHRIKLVQRFVDRMLVIFPFEEPFYRKHGVQAEFVGHPLADLPLPAITRQEFAAQSALDPHSTWIALLPGSRGKEIGGNLPEMLAGARLLAEHAPEERYEFVIPMAPTLCPEHHQMVERLIARHAVGLRVRCVSDAPAQGATSPGDTFGRAVARTALLHTRAAIVASGTATVEAALIGNPFVVVYRVSALTYAIAKRVVDVPHVAMANLIAGKRIVPELIQNDFTAQNIVHEIEALLPDGPPRQSMMQELQRVRALLSSNPGDPDNGAIGRVAAIALQYLGVPSPARESVPS
jgi:lipid-A-disaccharide synthase